MAIKIKQAVILAGGLGTRMLPLTEYLPKPMIAVQGRPFLEYLVELLRKNGISEIVLLLGYLPDKVVEHFGDGEKFGVRITYSITPVEDDTGTRLKRAEALLDDYFLLVYSDNYWPLNLERLKAFYEDKNLLASVVVYSNEDSITRSNMLVDDNGLVVAYDKSRTNPNLNGVEIGFFIVNRKILEFAPEGDFNFEKEIIQKLIASQQLGGYLTDHRYYSLGSIERLPVTEKFFEPRKIIFLDRDGVINKKAAKADYIKNWEEFEFLPGSIEGLKYLSDHRYEIYIITNQPGVARGVMSHADLDNIHAHMIKKLKEEGVVINGIYLCIHGWDEGCDCRKPKPGLLFRAANEHYFDITRTTFIGDDPRDVEAGRAAGSRTILMQTDGNLFEVIESIIKE